jgi:hypothetical protein
VAPASGQVLYKWTDAQGRIQYSDKAPKDFKGEVTRIESEPFLPPVVRPVPSKAPPAAGEAKDEKPDLNSQRRAVREKLAADVSRARERRDAARRALDEAEGPAPDEMQVIQQRVKAGGNPKPQPIPNRDATQSRGAGGGMHGMTAQRSNCREVVSGGKKTTICPTVVPGDAYHERIKRLEDELAAAEEALSTAERAYRLGVD